MLGFASNGVPIEITDEELNGKDWLTTCKEQSIPHSIGKSTYLEAVQEACPDMSLTHIRRLFKDKAIRTKGYECMIDEDPSELFSDTFVFIIIRIGKRKAVLFK